MNVSDFDFDLPDELIAQHRPRAWSIHGCSSSIAPAGPHRHTTIAELPSILVPGDVLVVNNTRVIAARLLGHRVPSGGVVECLLLGPTQRYQAFGDGEFASSSSWHPDRRGAAPSASGGRARASGAEAEARIADALRGRGRSAVAEVISRHFHGRRTIRLWVEGGGDVDALVDALGHMPLPPYIKRADTLEDRERYQTVYARVRGSVAAPTAGLHFTPELLAALRQRGVERARDHAARRVWDLQARARHARRGSRRRSRALRDLARTGDGPRARESVMVDGSLPSARRPRVRSKMRRRAAKVASAAGKRHRVALYLSGSPLSGD